MKKKSRKSDLTLESQLASIDLSTLQTCLEVYRRLKSSKEGCHFTELASELNIPLATIKSRVSRLEEAMSGLIKSKQVHMSRKNACDNEFYLFETKRGKRASVPKDPVIAAEVESIFFNISTIIEAWERISHRWGAGETVVRIATSLYAARKLMPALIQSPENEAVWFDITQTKSARLLEIARRKKCDLVLTEVATDFDANENTHVFDFSLVLVAPRGHWLEMEEGARSLRFEDILARLAAENTTLCMLPDDPAFYPRPDYPNEAELPAALRLLRVGSTTLCLALVMSSSAQVPIVSITIPQFLCEEDLERLVVIPINPRRRPVRLALIRPLKPEANRPADNEARTEVVARIEKGLVEQLEAFERQDDLAACLQNLWLYHSTKVGTKSYWQRGRLSWYVREPEDPSIHVFTGTHSIANTGQGLRYLIRGRSVMNGADSHVSYRARSIGGRGEDGYVFSGICPRFGDFGAGAITGIWQGVLSQTKRAKGQTGFLHGSGFVVISTEENADAECLNEYSRVFQSKYRDTLDTIFTAKALWLG